MKKAIFNTRSMVMTLMTIVTIGFTQVTLANDVANEETEKKLEFKYAGNMDNHPVFQLNLNNTEDDEFLVTIRDGNHDVLYLGRLKGKNISKKYRLDIDREDIQNVEFDVTSKKTQKSVVYKINQKVRMVEDVWVAKL